MGRSSRRTANRRSSCVCCGVYYPDDILWFRFVNRIYRVIVCKTPFRSVATLVDLFGVDGARLTTPAIPEIMQILAETGRRRKVA
jgi:hypothetical protein